MIRSSASFSFDPISSHPRSETPKTPSGSSSRISNSTHSINSSVFELVMSQQSWAFVKLNPSSPFAANFSNSIKWVWKLVNGSVTFLSEYFVSEGLIECCQIVDFKPNEIHLSWAKESFSTGEPATRPGIDFRNSVFWYEK